MLCIFVLLLPVVLSTGSIQTLNLDPGSVDLCGTYSQYVTITALNITNKVNTTLTSVNAKLYLTGNPGLNFITARTINLGNIAPLSQSAISPTWTLQCSSPVSGLRQ